MAPPNQVEEMKEMKVLIQQVHDALLGKLGSQEPGLVHAVRDLIASRNKQTNLMWTVLGGGITGSYVLLLGLWLKGH